jgi:hypothetical protein
VWPEVAEPFKTYEPPMSDVFTAATIRDQRRLVNRKYFAAIL